MASVFGWLPVFLWCVIGGIFFGGLQDFGSLVASLRHDGKSLGEIISDTMGKTAQRLFIAFALLVLILVIASFVNVVAGTFFTEGDAFGITANPNGNQATAMISLLFIVLAIIYGYATKVPNLISMVSTIFFQAWNMSAITENDSKDRNNFYSKVYGAYEALLFIASAFLIAGVQIVTPIFVSTARFGEYGEVYKYTPVLVIAVLFMCLDQFLSSVYTATKHTKNSFWTSFAASMANIVLNFFLIPEWGIQGASIATFLSYYLCFWARIIDARYYVPFRFDAVKSCINTTVLLVMCWIVIAKPAAFPLWLTVGIAAEIVLNYKAFVMTIMKMLKKG